MSDILIDDQSVPSAPAASQGLLYNDSISKILTERTSVRTLTLGGIRNASTGAQAYTTAEIYLAGSAIIIPSHLLQVGGTFRWRVTATKTAGTGAPVLIVKVGTLGTTGDTSRVTFTQVAAGTTAVDTAVYDISVVVRSIGAAGVFHGSLVMSHVLAATGFSTLDHNVMQVASAGFDTTVAALIVGLTFNHGTAGAGNIEQVTAEYVGG